MPRPVTPEMLQFITNDFGDELLYEVNRNTFSRLGADALYQQSFKTHLFKEDTLYLVVGTDSGLLPAWVMRRGLPAGSRYVFIELPELYSAIDERHPEFNTDDHIDFVTLENWAKSSNEFRFQDYAYLDRIVVIHSFAATDAFIPAYHDARYLIEQEVVRFTRTIKLTIGNHTFIHRQIENAADNLVPAKCLEGGFEAYTAVLLGGGPSLDDILPWVIKHRDRLIVIAVSRIARQLLAAGLEPDIVASVDPHPVSFDVSKEMLRFSEHCLLLNAFHVSPLLLAQWRGPAVYRGPHYPWQTTNNVENLPNAGPTVSNAALATLIEMGCSQIILGGVDLCFSREGYTHASGSNERKAGSSLGNVGIQVETNKGTLADTDPAFLQASSIMAAQAVAALAKGIKIINPAPQAARMEGVEHIPLDELVLPQDKIDGKALIATRLPSRDAATQQQALKSVKRELADTHGQIRAIMHLAEDALECNRGLFGRDGEEADFRHKKRMDKIEHKLDSKHKNISNLIKDFGAGLFLRLTRPDREREWTDDELEKFGDAYYKAYLASAKALLKMVEDTQKRTESRLHELDEQPRIVALFQQWQADRTPGRCNVIQLHSRDQLSEDEEKILALSNKVFEDILSVTNTVQAQQVKQTLGLSLAPVRSKLVVLFNKQDSDEISRLAEQIRNMAGHEASDLYSLAMGYLAEIDDDNDAALNHYNNILEKAADTLDGNSEKPLNPRLEDALRRMSHITLSQGNKDNALMVLDVLAAMSPVYEPQYGDLLRITGDIEKAIHIYTEYVQKVPSDLVNMLKLGKLYHDIGQTESAAWVYNHILEKDPNNTAAKQLLGSLDEKAT